MADIGKWPEVNGAAGCDEEKDRKTALRAECRFVRIQRTEISENKKEAGKETGRNEDWE